MTREDYTLLRNLAAMLVRLSPDIAVDEAIAFLEKEQANDYFELRLSEAGFKKITFKQT